MKRFALLLIIPCLHITLKASDTLTRGQIYNFEVGDTFDYVSRCTSPDFPPGYVCGGYERYVITAKTRYSDSVVYTRERLYPSPQTDQLLIGGLGESILYRDTGNFLIDSFSIGMSEWDSVYNEHYILPFENSVRSRYASGLGLIYVEWQEWADIHVTGFTKLIYFTKGNYHAGMPYTAQPSGVSDLFTPAMYVYPNPAKKNIHLSLPSVQPFVAVLIISNLMGQTVYQAPVTSATSSYDISGIPLGLYIWSVCVDERIIKTGKLVKD